MAALLDETIQVVMDISGGDACNEVLPYMDWEALRENTTFFFGYSDVSVLLNVLSERTTMKVFNFNTMTLLGEQSAEQLSHLREALCAPNSVSPSLQDIIHTDDIIRGGNLRCTLKLAGTPYWPSLNGRTLLLESLSGNWDRVRSYLTQLEQLGVFEQMVTLVIGQFQELEERGEREFLVAYLKDKEQDYGFSLRTTPLIGHSPHSVPVRYAAS